MTQFEDVLETILEEYARRDSEGEFDTWEETDAFVKKKAEVLLAYVKEEPVSEDLEAELDKYIKDNFTIDKEQLDRFGIEEKDYMYSMDKSDMEKMVRYFTGNYKIPVSDDLEEAAKLYVSDSLCITGEEDWDDAAIEALNAYKAGAKWQKEQVMAKAKSGTVQKNNQAILDNGTYIDLDPSMQLKPSFVGLKEGDRIKIIIIKED